MSELAILGGTVVTQRGIRKTDILVRDGRIARLGRVARIGKTVSARGLLVLPGAIDAHVHMSLPVAGTRSADDFRSGTLAAAAGGVTTLIDFTVGTSDQSIPEAIEARISEAAPSAVDFSLHAELVGWTPDRSEEIAEAAQLGVRSFGEIFTTYSESGRRTPLDHLKAAMEAIREIDGVAMVHAEADELICPEQGPYPSARPAIAEEVAIAEIGVLARHTGCQTYIGHISSAAGLSALNRARKSGAPVMGETCPQYLLLDDSVYQRTDGHQFSVVPPLRGTLDQHALWTGLDRRELQAVSTDHCPFTRAQKDAVRDEPACLPCGLPGVETLVSLLYSEGVARGKINLRRLAWVLAEGPAKAFGLWPSKGVIQQGADADLVLLDPDAAWEIRSEGLHMATDFSPYEARSIRGRVVGVLSRGEWLLRDGELLARPGRGRFIGWHADKHAPVARL